MINGTTDKLRGQVVEREHIHDRVRLTFDPKLFTFFDIVSDFVCFGFAGVYDDIIIIFTRDWSNTIFPPELTGEEVIP